MLSPGFPSTTPAGDLPRPPGRGRRAAGLGAGTCQPSAPAWPRLESRRVGGRDLPTFRARLAEAGEPQGWGPGPANLPRPPGRGRTGGPLQPPRRATCSQRLLRVLRLRHIHHPNYQITGNRSHPPSPKTTWRSIHGDYGQRSPAPTTAATTNRRPGLRPGRPHGCLLRRPGLYHRPTASPPAHPRVSTTPVRPLLRGFGLYYAT